MSFNLSNFLGDPFAISTISFGVLAWIITVAGAGASNQPKFPHFYWWGIVYEIVIILLILLLYLNNNIELYKFTLVGLVSVAFIYTTNAVNGLIYNSTSSANLCCAAGCILLSALNLIWIVYFGGHPESPTNQFVDSFSLKHSSNVGHVGTGTQIHDDDEEYKRYVSPVALPNSRSTNNFQDNNMRQSQLTTTNPLAPEKKTNPLYMSSSQLNGLENFSSSDVHQRELTSSKRQTVYTDNQQSGTSGMTFRYKAKALYSYDANPDDINEISFIKDEILEVDDIDGKWWQARRGNGQVGICPSNYVKLFET